MKTTRPLIVSFLLLAFVAGGCSKSLKSEDAGYGAAFRKSNESQMKDTADFSHVSWTAAEELKADGKVKPETLNSLKDIIERKKSTYAEFAAVKASSTFADFHAITTDFMKQTLDVDIEQVSLFESGEERQVNRMTDKIEKIGLEYQKKLKACMEKMDKGYFDLAMKSNDEFR